MALEIFFPCLSLERGCRFLYLNSIRILIVHFLVLRYRRKDMYIFPFN